jgi:pimeloyl-ACP methyl ester carboxylesterase
MPDTRSPFRVLILKAPTLLGDLLEDAMMDQTDFTVIHERDFTQEGRGVLAPDVVVLGHSDGDQVASILLARWPQSLVVTIADAGGATVYELEPMKVRVGDLSPNELLQALRPMIRRDTGFRARRSSSASTRRRR